MVTRLLAAIPPFAMFLIAACASEDAEAPKSGTTPQTAACTAANATCVSEDTSGCTGKAYPYCLPPTGQTYCSWAFRGRVLSDVACIGRASCCFVPDGGAEDASTLDAAVIADAKLD